jgi:hypothetical protein
MHYIVEPYESLKCPHHPEIEYMKMENISGIILKATVVNALHHIY